jgi:hypothetical protein
MENCGTAVLLTQKSPRDGGDLILVVDFQLKILSLVEVSKSSGLLNVRDIKNYTKIGSVKSSGKKK